MQVLTNKQQQQQQQLILLMAALSITASIISASDNTNNHPTTTSHNELNQAAECTNCTICPYPCTHSGKPPPSPSGSYYAPPGVGLPVPGASGNCPPGTYPGCCQGTGAGQQQGGGQQQQYPGYFYAPPYMTDNLAPGRSRERWIGVVMAAVLTSSAMSVLSGLW